MIGEVLSAVTARLDAALGPTLATLPGGLPVLASARVVLSRHLIDDGMLTEDEARTQTPLVRVEQDGEVTLTWPHEDAEGPVLVSVRCRCVVPRAGLNSALTDDEMSDAVRSLARGVAACLLRWPITAQDVNGVQVRHPSAVTLGEPLQGSDAGLTVMDVAVTVPALDFWSLEAAA